MQKHLLPVSKLSLFPVLLLLWFATLASCTNTKNIPYFKDFADTAKPKIVSAPAFVYPVIKPDDVLMITIQTLDPEANPLFAAGNTPVAAVGANSGGVSGNQFISGYLVDRDGNVDIPVVGKMHLEGYTTLQAKTVIKEQIDKLYKNASIDVRYNNFKITVMGEVNRPATYIIPNEKISILDALGMAGDLTIFGRRENVLLLRDTLGAKKMVRLNLNSSSIISSPYFYMQQNDILYVEPSPAKIETLDAYRNRDYTIAAAILTVLIVIGSRVIK